MPQFTIEQLGQRVKGRSGGKLDGFSDADVGQRVFDRNPDRFKGVIATAPAPVQEQHIDTGRGAVADFGVGAGKGVLSTIKGASGLGEKLLRGGLKTVLPKSLESTFGVGDEQAQPTSIQQLQTQAESGLGLEQGQLTTPQNTAQKVGFGAEQVAEFFIPGGAVTKAGKAAELATKAKTGAGAVSKLLGLGSRAGIEAGAALGQTAIQQGEVGKEALTSGALGGAFPLAGAVLKPVFKGTGRIGAEILGKTTGAKTQSIKEAFKNPNVVKFIRRAGGNIDELQDETFNLSKKGLNVIKRNRSNAYQGKLAKIKLDTRQLDGIKREVTRRLKSHLDDIGAKVNVNNIGIGKGGKLNQIDFSETSLVEGVNVVERAINTITGWADNTPVGLDKLKQRLGDLSEQLAAPGKSKAHRIVLDLKNTVREGLEKNVSGYKDMTAGYRQASDLIDELNRTLSLSGKRTKEQALTKLQAALRPGKERRAELVKELQESIGEDITGRIAASNLAPATPTGLIGALSPGLAGGGLVTFLSNPSSLPALLLFAATASPRLMGEMVGLLGRATEQIARTGALTNALQRSFRELFLEIESSND